jgi:hypothetical protein
MSEFEGIAEEALMGREIFARRMLWYSEFGV